jgi:hypothetical protein
MKAPCSLLILVSTGSLRILVYLTAHIYNFLSVELKTLSLLTVQDLALEHPQRCGGSCQLKCVSSVCKNDNLKSWTQ